MFFHYCTFIKLTRRPEFDTCQVDLMIAAAERVRLMVQYSLETLPETTCDHKSPVTREVLQTKAFTAMSQAVLSSAGVWKSSESSGELTCNLDFTS